MRRTRRFASFAEATWRDPEGRRRQRFVVPREIQIHWEHGQPIHKHPSFVSLLQI